jgi:hypothetical protein
MRWLAPFLVLAWLTATTAASAQRPLSQASIAGIVTDPALGELSGLARSLSLRDRYWAINDGGYGNYLLLVDGRGRVQRKLEVSDAENVDWEDLASFRWRDANWLLIADTGDNAGIRDHVSLWMLREPEGGSGTVKTTGPALQLRLRYPDEPHDVEAITVDAVEGAIYLLTKRTVPPVLYRAPLAAIGSREIVIAERIATLDLIPQPTESEILRDGSLSRYRSQVTAMELDCDQRGLLVLTYDAIYRFVRTPGQSWGQALARQTPARSPLSLLPQAEAMALDRECRNLFVGSEKAPVPLLRFRYRPIAGSATKDHIAP